MSTTRSSPNRNHLKPQHQNRKKNKHQELTNLRPDSLYPSHVFAAIRRRIAVRIEVVTADVAADVAEKRRKKNKILEDVEGR